MLVKIQLFIANKDAGKMKIWIDFVIDRDEWGNFDKMYIL